MLLNREFINGRWLAACAAMVVLSGCGPAASEVDVDEESPDSVEASAEPSPAAPSVPWSDDLMPAGDSAGETLLQAPGDPAISGAPKVIFLHYADGRSFSRTSPDPCRGTAPKFVCDFAPSLAECQRQIQAYLDKWYADFNVVFTLTRPTSGSFYTEIVSSGGGVWCDAADNVAGIAPFLCDDLAGGTAYTFLGGKNAKDTAIIIAQEQAHLVGLEHTLSGRDIMDPTICPNCDGFENVDNKIQTDHCGRARQNSFQMMKDRLGGWTGGAKPELFGCDPDTSPPLAQISTPVDNATVAETFQLRVQASDECKVSRVSVSVNPMGLHAQSTAPPYEWTLTRIAGRQTITVTVSDQSGKEATSSVTVNAPGSAGGTGGAAGASGGGSNAETGAAPAAGCDVGGCDVAGRGHASAAASGWGAASATAVLLVLAGLRAPRRRAVRVTARSARRRR